MEHAINNNKKNSTSHTNTHANALTPPRHQPLSALTHNSGIELGTSMFKQHLLHRAHEERNTTEYLTRPSQTPRTELSSGTEFTL